MASRIPLVAGNWKMHKTIPEALEFCEAFVEQMPSPPAGVEVAVCPPFPALHPVAQRLRRTKYWVAAQAVHESLSGAHTGEVSAPMIGAAGATGTLVGHSERRAAGETDTQVAERVKAATDADLRVIMCVGESLEVREAGETDGWLTAQVTSGLALLDHAREQQVTIAYEPIWAIGTGVVATPDQAQEACAHVRLVASNFVDGARLRVLYGGSVSPDNAGELMALPDVDGALVGGASLDPDKFARIVEAAT